MVGDQKYQHLKTIKTPKRERMKQSSISIVCSWRKIIIFSAFKNEPSTSCKTMSWPSMILMRHHSPSPFTQSEDEPNKEQLH